MVESLISWAAPQLPAQAGHCKNCAKRERTKNSTHSQRAILLHINNNMDTIIRPRHQTIPVVHAGTECNTRPQILM